MWEFNCLECGKEISCQAFEDCVYCIVCNKFYDVEFDYNGMYDIMYWLVGEGYDGEVIGELCL